MGRTRLHQKQLAMQQVVSGKQCENVSPCVS